MGKIYFKNNIINYDEADHKTILDILRDNKIYFDAPCGGNKTCGMCKIQLVYGNIIIDGKVVSLSDTRMLACDSIPIGDLELNTITEDDYEIETNFDTIIGGHEKVHSIQIGIAIDLGTTTLVLYFYNLISNEIIAIQTAVNEQRSYGADVISRIKYYCEHENKKLLQDVIVSQINKIIGETCELYGFENKQILKMVIAGNTVMEHLISGLDVASIGETPYVPTSLFGIEERAMTLGINVNQKATVFLSPCVSGFVGGDITIGLLSCNIDKTTDNVLYIDIGTNGEVALKANGTIYCCAAAAGPAFEGAHISCGMGGQSGAVSSVYSDETGKIKVTTINNTVPIGICGSGLIDAVTVCLRLSEIDETGKIVNGTEIKIADNVVLTQKDIREVQLAKSAICAGILTLISCADITVESIDEVLIAGGFGTKINPRSACAIGLIPKELLDKVKAIGNASGVGASKILLKPYQIDRLQDLAESCKYIELSDSEFFNEEYVNQMIF